MVLQGLGSAPAGPLTLFSPSSPIIRIPLTYSPPLGGGTLSPAMAALTTLQTSLLEVAALHLDSLATEFGEDQRPLTPLLPTPVGFYVLAAALAAASQIDRTARLQALRRSRRRHGR